MPEPLASNFACWVRQRLPALGLRPERELEIVEELAIELEARYEAGLAAGREPAEARRLAEAEIPDWQTFAAALRAAERPLAASSEFTLDPPTLGRSPGAPMTNLWHDLRYAWRSLAASSGLSTVMVLTLALGIGATTTIYSYVHGLLLKPLPFHDAERLVVLHETPRGGGQMSISWPNYRDWRARTKTFTAMAASRFTNFTLTGSEAAEHLSGRAASGNFFSLLGASAQLGRLISDEDDRAGAPEVVVISDRFWRRRFGGSPSALGQSLMLSERPHTVIGVLPPDFQFTQPVDAFVALTPTLGPGDQDRGNHWGIRALAHLAPGVSFEQARIEMEALAAALAQEYPATNSGNGVELNTLRDYLAADIRTTVLLLLAGVCAVLLIACVNLASLLLARNAAREGEMAIRVALGAGRGRITRQILTESLLLAGAGGLAGIWMAFQAVPLLRGWLPRDVPRLETVTLDRGVLGFALAVSVVTGLAFSLMPALRAARSGLARAGARPRGAGSSHGGAQSSYRRALLAGEIALCLILLTAAGLMLRTVLGLAAVDPGFEVERRLALSLDLGRGRYDDQAIRVAYREITERVAAVPGVESAGLTLSLPFEGSNWGSVFVVENQTVPTRADLPSAAFTPVSPSFFETLGVHLLEGRLFDHHDSADSTYVTLINETMARRFWPGESALGKRIKQGWPESDTPWREVVGVVADVKLEGVAADTPLQSYLPLEQASWVTRLSLVVRTAQDPASAATMIKAALADFDRDMPVYEVRTLEKVFADSIATQRLPTLLLSQFSLAALLLAAIGIFGMMAYSVAQRRHEMGLRMALGATSLTVQRQVLGEGIRVVGIGVVLGLAGAFMVTRYLRSLLFEVEPIDPLSLALAVSVLVLVALAAAYLPARRAARVDPMVALRAE